MLNLLLAQKEAQSPNHLFLGTPNID